MIYWDTSAVFKLYVAEPDSPYFLDLLSQTQEQVACSEIMRVEMLCSLWRKERSGQINSGAAKTSFERLNEHIEGGMFVLIPYGPKIVAEAEQLLQLVGASKAHPLIRSLDTIHVASALESNATSLIATGIALRKIATLAGLRALPE